MNTQTLKGLSAYIYQSEKIGNCSNSGLSSKYKEVIVIDPKAPQIFPVTDERPAVVIIRRNIGGQIYVHAEPLIENKQGKCLMAGGTFIYSCDSRFEEVTGVSYPISLHDRME